MRRSECRNRGVAAGEKVRPGAAGWLALMDVDLRVVAVKLTNRFCEVDLGRRSTLALLKYAEAGEKERGGEGRRVTGNDERGSRRERGCRKLRLNKRGRV